VNRNSLFSGVLDDGDDIFCIARTDYTHGTGLHNTGISRIKLLRNLITTDISFNQSSQIVPQSYLLSGGQRHGNNM
jgi:hypothetical protein